MTCDSESITIGTRATSATIAVAIAETGSDDATDDGIISVVLVTGAAMVGTGTQNTRGVGYPVSSLKVALRLLETRVSITNAKEV